MYVFFNNYNHIRRKYSFSRWYKYTQKRKYKRALCTHIFGNQLRRQMFLSFRFWHRQSVHDQHQKLHDKKQLMIATSTWRQLKKKKLRKLIRAWKDYVSHDMPKRRTILELFKWKRRDLLMRAWSRIKTSDFTLEFENVLDHRKFDFAISIWRQFRQKKCRVLLYAWRQHVLDKIEKRRIIFIFIKPFK